MLLIFGKDFNKSSYFDICNDKKSNSNAKNQSNWLTKVRESPLSPSQYTPLKIEARIT